MMRGLTGRRCGELDEVAQHRFGDSTSRSAVPERENGCLRSCGRAPWCAPTAIALLHERALHAPPRDRSHDTLTLQIDRAVAVKAMAGLSRQAG